MVKYREKDHGKDVYCDFSKDIACKIFKSLGFETQNTILGELNGRDCVACENFLKDNEVLQEFSNFTNSSAYATDKRYTFETIINTIENEWQVEVEVNEVFYEGDETATANLPYCQSFNPEITECAVFSTNFHIPEQDVEMAWAFEPNTDINWWSWILGKNTAGEWEVLTNGFG